MKIVGIAACTSGIAHTYIAKEKLVMAAKELGHEVHIETQGTIGTEDELTAKDIEAADVVIIAADIKVGGKRQIQRQKNRRGSDPHRNKITQSFDKQNSRGIG